MYHALWADFYLSSALPALEATFFSQLEPGSKVLDVCCGSGHVTKELIKRGFAVTGVDASANMLAIAQRELPAGTWLVRDARDLGFHQQFPAALSTFDSLNHLLSTDDLRKVFESVRQALQPGGRFVFDMNLDEAYRSGPQHWVVEVKDSSISLIRGSYDPETRMVETELIWFLREEGGELWRQQRSVIKQRSYSQHEILVALSQAGFHDIEARPAEEAGMTDGLGIGRLFVSALA